jgi:hypothetical protein
MKLIRFGIPAAFAVALVAMGCGGGDFIDSDRSNGLNGTWVLDSMTANGTTVTCPGDVDFTGFTMGCSRYTIVYTKEGKFTQTSADGTQVVNGTFNFDGSVLTTNYGNGNETVSVPLVATNNGATYSITVRQNGFPVTYSFVRQAP